MAADVRRFGHVINKDGVLGTHSPLERGGDLYRKREPGKLTWSVTPQGSLAVAQIRPSCASMIERQMESPIPMPVDFVE